MCEVEVNGCLVQIWVTEGKDGEELVIAPELNRSVSMMPKAGMIVVRV